jgi:transposase
MFVKETRVKRKSGRVITYLQLVSSYWDKERKTPRHKVLCSLGRLENLDKGRIQDLVDQLSSYLDEPKVTSDGLLKVGETLEFGIPYLVKGVWKRLKLDGFFQEELKKRKYEKPVHQAILGMVINRCQHPYSKRSTEEWLSKEVYFPPAKELELQHYYRGMDFLLDTGRDLELALYDHYSQLFDRTTDMVFYDTTSSYFETDNDQEEELRQYGYSRDHRPGCKQILLGLAVDKDGLPLGSDIFPGNTQDVETVQQMVAKLKSMGIQRCIFVSDSGMVSKKNLDAIKEAGLDTLVGMKMRQLEEIQQHVLSKRGPFIQLPCGLGVKEVPMDGYRYIVVHNKKQARKDARIRAEVVARLETLLAEIEAGEATVCQIQQPMMKRFVRTLKDGRVKLNATKVRKDARYDGKYVLRTTSDLSLPDIVAAYKTLQQVEQGFRTIKTVLRVRPMYHHADHRIISHVKLCVLAYFIVRHVEVKTGQSWEQIARLFRRLHVAELITDAGVVFRRSELSKEHKAILKALKIPYPKEIQDVNMNS